MWSRGRGAQLVEPAIRLCEGQIGRADERVDLLGLRGAEAGVPNERGEIPLEDRPRLVEFKHRRLGDALLVQPRQVNEEMLGMQAIAVWLEGEHQLEVTAAKGNDGIREAKRARAERVGELGEVPLGVEPEDETALAHPRRDLGSEARAGDVRGRIDR